jgi:hypothetical protein
MKRLGQTVVLRFQSRDPTGNLLVMGMSSTTFVREEYFRISKSLRVFSQCTSPESAHHNLHSDRKYACSVQISIAFDGANLMCCAVQGYITMG